MEKQRVKVHKGSHILEEKFIGQEGYIIKNYLDFAGIDSQGVVLKGYKVKLDKYKKPMMFYEDELYLI